MSQITKKALAGSLKTLLASKPLDKITVSDIVEDCQVNRKTFYYHFKDIYDLVDWMFLTEGMQYLEGNTTYNTWTQGFMLIFDYILHNKAMVVNIYHSVSREQLEQYLHEVTYELLQKIMVELSQDVPVREKDLQFVINFYKYAFVGILVEWIRTGMKEDPKVITERLNRLIHGDFAKAMERFRTDGH